MKPEKLLAPLLAALAVVIPARADAPAWADTPGGAVGYFILGTMEGRLLAALLLTAIFMVCYIAWRRRKK